MGVLGLWQLLDAVGHPVTIESLENKILAVDVSILLNQSIKGFRDVQGQPLHNAHLLGLFHRISKLLFYRIKPVFVFDGGVPQLKKRTLEARQNKRSEAGHGSQTAAQKILSNYLMSHVLKQHTRTSSTKSKSSSPTKKPSRVADRDEDLYKLPPLPTSTDENEVEIPPEDDPFAAAPWLPEGSEYQQLDAIDIESEDFKCLPPEIRHELLLEMKERQRRHIRFNHSEVPEDSQSFSSYQMARLLHKRKLQQQIEQVRKEMNVEANNPDYEGVESVESGRIVSEDLSQYILIKGLKKRKASRTDSNTAEAKNSKLTTGSDSNDQHKSLPKDGQWSATAVTPSINHEVKAKSSAEDGDGISLVKGLDIKLDSGQEIILDDSGSAVEWSSSPEAKSENKDIISRVKLDGGQAAEWPSTSEDKNKISGVKQGSGQVVTLDKQQSSSVSLELETKVNFDASSGDGNELLAKEGEVKMDTSLDEHRSAVHQEKNYGEQPEIVVVAKVPHCDSISSINHPQHQAALNINDAASTENIVSALATTVPEKHKMDSAGHDENMALESVEMPETSTSVVPSMSASNAIEVTIDPSAAPDDDLFPADIFQTEGPPKDIRSPPRVVTLNDEDIIEIQEQLEEESHTLIREKGKLDRQATSVADYMYQECQELLRLFGIPYVVSPLEAEAQCAYLDVCGLTQGTITDDSDIWLFGGKHVYKNFFMQGKYVQRFDISDIEKEFGLDRSKLIALAMMSGSDYTQGIEGIGPVTSVEVLSEFPATDGFESLVLFKDWMHESKSSAQPPGNPTRAKFLKFQLAADFPSRAVYDAYLHPEVDPSCEKFSWGVPRLDDLRAFALDRLGWTQSKADELLLPVMKKALDDKVQLRIDSFLLPSIQKEKNLFPSKRVQKAVHKMTSGTKGADGKGRRTRGRGQTKRMRRSTRPSASQTVSRKLDLSEDSSSSSSSSSD